MAGVHGDELEPILAVRRLARRLRRSPPLAGSVTLVPIANPSACRLKQRCGSDGLDLARTFPGRSHGSLTERIAWELTKLIQSADCLIDLHTGGAKYDLWPLAGYLLHSDPLVLAEQRRMARAFNLPVVWGTDANVSGRSLSAARDANKPAIYVEYRGGRAVDRVGVERLVDGCLHVIAALDMSRLPEATCQVRYFAEDARAGAGHLQAAHPAPVVGRFSAVVQPGDQVTRGQLLGVIKTQTDQSIEIRSQQDGRVVCIHRPTPVTADEGVAVVVSFLSAPVAEQL
ncbi:MAG: succinylglutamate desuccinylase/aspartoacylase family protein [Pirellulales bacterium]|nr:succinylglutamate desuccinylase/aspartoacylase family protein [Pirellulales bacterium]